MVTPGATNRGSCVLRGACLAAIGEEIGQQAGTLFSPDPLVHLKLVVQPGVGPQVVKRPKGPSIWIRGSPYNPAQASRPGRARTHWARFKSHDKGRSGKTPGAHLGSRIPEGQQLGVGCRIDEALPLIVSTGHDPVADGHHRPDRHLSGLCALSGLSEGHLH